MSVIVTSREELSAIVSQVVRREVGALMQDLARQDPRQSLKPEDAAKYLGQSVNTLRQWRSQGRGPAYEKHSRNVRYKIKDLDAWRDSSRVLTYESLDHSSILREAKKSLPSAGASHV